MFGEVKMVLVIRTDIGMNKGKMCAQASHGAVMCALETQYTDENMLDAWMLNGMKKIVLKVGSLEELDEIQRKAQEAGVRYSRITDWGLTQIEPNTVTCLALGPDEGCKLDAITGGLKLL